MVTRGTITRPASMVKAPAFMGDRSSGGKLGLKNMFAIINTVANMKQHHTAGLEVLFQYSPNRNGARNAPASAPHETPMSCAMKVIPPLYCIVAITDEMMMKKAIRILIINKIGRAHV